MPQKPSERDYKAEYKRYHGKPEQIKNRAERVMARRAMVKKGKARKGDGKDVHHVVPLINGGTRADGIKISTRAKNRGFKRNAKNKPI